jgi:endonuclease-3
VWSRGIGDDPSRGPGHKSDSPHSCPLCVTLRGVGDGPYAGPVPAPIPTTKPDTSLVRRARRMDRILAATYPDAAAELDFTNAFECLVVTVVSAQTTDRRVNAASPALFAAYPTPQAMAAAPREHLEQLLGPLGFFRAKTDSLLKLSQALVERYDGEVPKRLDITVDTHFGRLVRRFGWTEETDPVKVEHAVAALFPKRDWTMLSHHLIWHGRRRCHAKKPACGACPIARLCPSYGIGPTDPIEAEKLVTTQGPA